MRVSVRRVANLDTLRGITQELGELFVKREHFDVYVCPRCGRVELFVDGIGEEFRPH